MPKYFNLWEMDTTRMPTDPNERMAVLKKLLEITKQYLKENPGSEWGAFIGESKGYSSGSVSWQELTKVQQMLAPYVHFKIYQAVSVEELEEFYKPMMAKAQQK